MKRGCLILVAFLLVAAAIPAYASGKVWSEVKGDTAIVHHDDAWWNCCPDTVFEIKHHPDTTGIIDIYEYDLDTHPCDCMCYFDFAHTLCGLTPGTYLARVWEVFGDGAPQLAGTTTFTILAYVGSTEYRTHMSECHEAVGEKPASEGNELKLEAPSLSPGETSVNIRYWLPSATDVVLTIYDVTGTRIRTLDLGNQEEGDHLVVWDVRDQSGQAVPRGIYLVRLQVANQARSLKLIVLR